MCFVDERISIFFSTLKLRKTFRTMREEEEQTMHATTTNTVHELRVIVRDARGMREEAPLRVHAKFDDEEEMTVSNRVYISLFLLFVCTLERKFVDQRMELTTADAPFSFLYLKMKTESGETVDEPEMEPAVSVLANAFGDEEDIATRRRFVEVDRTDGEHGGGRRGRRAFAVDERWEFFNEE